MIDQKLTIHVSGDYRTVRAYRPNGEEYGRLAVLGHWSHSAHTREVRLAVNRLQARGELVIGAGQDPTEAYKVHTAARIKATLKSKRPSPSKDATTLARTLQLQGLGSYVAPPKPAESPPIRVTTLSAARWRAALRGEEGDDHGIV